MSTTHIHRGNNVRFCQWQSKYPDKQTLEFSHVKEIDLWPTGPHLCGEVTPFHISSEFEFLQIP